MTDNVQYEIGERLLVTLQRPESSVPWGFRLQGGVDFSTPLSIQIVQPNSVAQRYGLKPDDVIERVNTQNADQLTHEEAKKEIIRSGNDIDFVIRRGARRIWKPQVTPMSELKPAQIKPVQTATGDEFIAVQKTSLASNRSQQESSNIGSSHNRAARPFGAESGSQNKGSLNVVHSQFNSPIGIYSADNIAETYATQTVGMTDQMQGLDISQRDAGAYQPVDSPSGDPQHVDPKHEDPKHEDPKHDTDCVITDVSQPPPTNSALQPDSVNESNGYVNDSTNYSQSRSFQKLQDELDQQQESSGYGPSGFRSVRAPETRPGGPSQQPKPSAARCAACSMLITGMFVRAAGQPFHVQCLKCVTCGMNLKQKGYIVVEGRLYCDIHAKRAAQPPGPGLVAVPTFQ